MSQRTLYSLLDEAVRQYGTATALYQPLGSKSGAKYREYSWVEYRDAAREIACGLRSLGIQKGDIVALDSETRAEFYLADLGVIANGSIAAALYTSLPPQERAIAMQNSDAKAVFAEDAKTMAALLKAGAPKEGLHWILLAGSAEGAMSFDQLRSAGRAEMERDAGYFDRIQAEVGSEDPAILYLTSGATGVPKMGLATHRAVLANCDMGPVVLPALGPKDRTLVFLPSAHIAQRVVLQMLPLRCGVPVYFSEGLPKMPAELRSVKPTFFLAPPRVWERMYDSICAELRKRPPVARRVFYTALGLGAKVSQYRRENRSAPAWMKRGLALADRIVFSKIRARLGGELKLAASGAAPLGRDLAQFFDSINLPLIEGYGLTEGGVATLNPLHNPRPGSIGKLLPGVEMRLADDGELLLKSACLFSGYYKDPEATAAVLRDGWLHTGDIAEVDQDGYIYITGRKKELIVSSNGKKIYPSRIESLFKVEPLINQVILIGDRQPYVTALFTLNVAGLDAVEGLGMLKGRPLPELAKSDAVMEEVNRAVKRANKQLAPFEHIKRFRILDRDFSIENGELTPTMKVRRKQVLENFKDTVNELYLGREEMS